MGDNLASSAMENDWAGIIVFGCIRDSAIINKMEIGVKALNTTPAKTVKRNVGELNVPLHFGDTVFTPGDYLYADEDGVIVSSQQLH